MSEEGHVAVELALGLCLLVLPMALLALSLPTWVQRQAIATAAAQEAARSVVVSGSAEEGRDAGLRIVAEAAVNNGIEPVDLAVCFVSHDVTVPAPGGCGSVVLERGTAVTAHVRVRLPALSLPGSDASFGAVARTVSHTEQVDRYRGRP